MKNILFVAFSHKLQPKQIADLKTQYGIEESNIVLLSKVNPALAETCKQVDPNASLDQVKELSALVVVEACKVGATHFYCQGEPTLAMWANLFMSGHAPKKDFKSFIKIQEWGDFGGRICFRYMHDSVNNLNGIVTCIVSTTERRSIDDIQPDGIVIKRAVFNHVKWRKLF